MNCPYCCEPVFEHERKHGRFHLECAVRSVAGSAAHQLHKCPCYGGTKGEPIQASRREQAWLAYQVFCILNDFPVAPDEEPILGTHVTIYVN